MNNKISGLLSFILLLIACQNPPLSNNVVRASPPTHYTAQIIDAPNQTFGYDIYSDVKLIIHQPNIPSFAGDDGFKKRQQAEQTAELVIQKMKRGEMPPSVTPEEIKQLIANF